MRIVGGRLGGRRLRAPAGRGTRPTTDRVREALFNILGQSCAGLAVLDLFAGSGALGLEALSRGAASCLWVEKSPAVAVVIRRNLADLGLAEEAGGVLVGDALALGGRLAAAGPFDLVLADPPYERGLVGPTVALAAGLLAPGGRLALEHSPRERPEAAGGLLARGRRAYGQSELSFFSLDEDLTP